MQIGVYVPNEHIRLLQHLLNDAIYDELGSTTTYDKRKISLYAVLVRFKIIKLIV